MTNYTELKKKINFVSFWINKSNLIILEMEGHLLWYKKANDTIGRNSRLPVNPKSLPAKNIILFVGDGMGLTTITAARILRGQQMQRQGEETDLAFDMFENVGLAKVS